MSDSKIHSAVKNLFDDLTAKPRPAHCRKCRSKLIYVDATFFSQGPTGKVWTVPLPVCPRCDLIEDTAQLVPPFAC